MAGLPDPAAPEVTELTDLPWAAELGRIKARMEARAAATAAAATVTPTAPAPRAAFDPDHATLDELDAQMALLASRKARIQREATIKASVGTGSAAAAAMAAAEVPEGGKRAAEPTPGGAPQSSAASRKLQRGRVPNESGLWAAIGSAVGVLENLRVGLGLHLEFVLFFLHLSRTAFSQRRWRFS